MVRQRQWLGSDHSSPWRNMSIVLEQCVLWNSFYTLTWCCVTLVNWSLEIPRTLSIFLCLCFCLVPSLCFRWLLLMALHARLLRCLQNLAHRARTLLSLAVFFLNSLRQKVKLRQWLGQTPERWGGSSLVFWDLVQVQGCFGGKVFYLKHIWYLYDRLLQQICWYHFIAYHLGTSF